MYFDIYHEGFRTYNSRCFEILKEQVDDLDRIILLPIFESHDLHTKLDMPGLLGIESDFDEDVVLGHFHHHYDHDDEKIEFDSEIVLTDPLGIDTRLYEIIKDRVSDYL